MGCCGEHRKAIATRAATAGEVAARLSDHLIYPADGCVLCAEKHLSTAFALAGEAGYAAPNRQRIIGELTAAALHLFKEHKELAEAIRVIRHSIQQRKEEDAQWIPALADMDALVNDELTKGP